jgi:hypothetical protein
MKKIILIVIAIALVYGFVHENGISIPTSFSQSSQNSDSTLQKAYKSRQSDLQVQGKGVVIKLLRDDLKGSRHQKFILKLSTGQTLLISHNIDLAPRIDRLRTGDTVEFYGEYEWNSKGGVIHWTHHDPDGRHAGGWLKHKSKTYQ